MPRYIITERAGRFVAGHTNTGVGTTLDITERAAAHEVRLGTLIPEVATIEPVAPAPEPVAAQPAEAPADEVETPKPRSKKPRAE